VAKGVDAPVALPGWALRAFAPAAMDGQGREVFVVR
jgi:hypothetical protein